MMLPNFLSRVAIFVRKVHLHECQLKFAVAKVNFLIAYILATTTGSNNMVVFIRRIYVPCVETPNDDDHKTQAVKPIVCRCT